MTLKRRAGLLRAHSELAAMRKYIPDERRAMSLVQMWFEEEKRKYGR